MDTGTLVFEKQFYNDINSRYFIPDAYCNEDVSSFLLDKVSPKGGYLLSRVSGGYSLIPKDMCVCRQVSTLGSRVVDYVNKKDFLETYQVSEDAYPYIADNIDNLLEYCRNYIDGKEIFIAGIFSKGYFKFREAMLKKPDISDLERGVKELFVSDIKENYDIYGLPAKFADCLPEFCEVCGAPLAMRETLTGLHCSNPKCPDKVVKRIEMICNDLNILNFGESTIQKYVETYNVTNPLRIFSLCKGMSLGDDVSPKVSEKVVDQILTKRKFLLWEFVMYANLPEFKTNARKVFQGYSSLTEAYNDIEAGGVRFIQEKLGTSNEWVSITALKAYRTLIEYKEELFEGASYVEIEDIGNKRELNVVCSDEVGAPFRKKAEFYAYISDTFGDKARVNFLSSVTKSIDYLVWKGADGSPARYTSKVKTVEGWNSRGKTNIPIITAEQFISVMHDL